MLTLNDDCWLLHFSLFNFKFFKLISLITFMYLLLKLVVLVSRVNFRMRNIAMNETKIYGEKVSKNSKRNKREITLLTSSIFLKRTLIR